MNPFKRVFTLVFGTKQSKQELYKQELQHVDFQLRDGYGENRMKLEKRQVELREILGIPPTQNG